MQFFTKLEPCLIGMEACGSSHYWARELTKLGHDVRLIPANYVKPYVKRGKSDANDAEAICEAVTRPTMRLVAPKSEEQQAVLFPHRARFDRQAANATEQHASQPAGRVWCHHSTRNWSSGQIRERCSRRRETRPTTDLSRCSETTQPPTYRDASKVPLVRDTHAASFETGQTRYAVAHDPRRWARHRVSHCCHSWRR